MFNTRFRLKGWKYPDWEQKVVQNGCFDPSHEDARNRGFSITYDDEAGKDITLKAGDVFGRQPTLTRYQMCQEEKIN